MNASTDSFIPCRGVDGAVREEGLKSALLDAHTITELADASPLGVISQLRLLLAVVIRVFPLKDDEAWLELFAQGQFPTGPVEKYLAEWHDRFELFGEKPFLQVASLTTDKIAPLSKMVPEISAGNNATLFDHTTDNSNTAYSPAEALRMLLIVQSFGLGGLLKAKGTVSGQAFTHPNATDSAIARGLTVWLTGENLFQTLLLNHPVYAAKAEDKPCWEGDDDAYFARGVTVGMLDRYTGLSRRVRLIEETDAATGQTVVRRMFLTQGRAFDKTQTDPMQCYREDPKAGRKVVLLNEAKATWRDLTALLEMNQSKGVRPAALITVGRLRANHKLPEKLKGKLRLHVAGLSSDKAKVLLWRHDRVSLPAEFLADEKLVALLDDLLGDAKTAADVLRQRVRALCYHFLSPVKGMISPDPGNVSALLAQIDTRRTFWAHLEGYLPDLLTGLVDRKESEKAMSAWHAAIQKEFTAAIRSAVNQLGNSPRAWAAAANISDYYFIEGEDKK